MPIPPETATQARQPQPAGADFKFFPGTDVAGASRRDRFASRFEVELAAAPGDQAVVVKAKARAAERDFEQRGRLRIPDEKICDPRRMKVKRAA